VAAVAVLIVIIASQSGNARASSIFSDGSAAQDLLTGCDELRGPISVVF